MSVFGVPAIEDLVRQNVESGVGASEGPDPYDQTLNPLPVANNPELTPEQEAAKQAILGTYQQRPRGGNNVLDVKKLYEQSNSETWGKKAAEAAAAAPAPAIEAAAPAIEAVGDPVTAPEPAAEERTIDPLVLEASQAFQGARGVAPGIAQAISARTAAGAQAQGTQFQEMIAAAGKLSQEGRDLEAEQAYQQLELQRNAMMAAHARRKKAARRSIWGGLGTAALTLGGGLVGGLLTGGSLPGIAAGAGIGRTGGQSIFQSGGGSG